MTRTKHSAIGRHHAPPSVTRWVLAAATLAWIVLALAGASGGPWKVLRSAVGVILVAAAAGLLANRLRRSASEREMWRPTMLAVLAAAVGYTVQTLVAVPVADLVGAGEAWRTLPLTVAVLVACVLLYRGLVQWNRFRTAMSDPADWLNGLSSVLAFAAGGNLVIGWSNSALTRWPGWQQQLWLLALGATVILLATMAAVASAAELSRDSRSWLLSGGVTIALGGLIAAPWSAVPPFAAGSSSQNCWMIGLALIAFTSSQEPKLIESQPSTNRSTTIGTLVVMGTSVAILAVCAESRVNDQAAAIYSVAAFIGSSMQGARMLRELAQLAQSRLEARTDGLTEVANRRELVSRLEVAAGQQVDVALLLVDLDHFKDINDRYGHPTGDEVLKQLASRLRRCSPANALVARLGGDEFAVLLRDTPGAEVKEIVTRLAASLPTSTEIHGRRLSVGVSIGVALRSAFLSTEVDGGEMLRRADVAMYVAKRNNLDVSIYDEALDRQARDRSVRSEQLRAILTDDAPSESFGRLLTFYQPQIDAATGAVVGVEALVRWSHPTLGILNPDAFLPLVEEHGLMPRLTAHVLEQAVGQAADWRAAGAPVRMAVNVSASSLGDSELPHTIAAALNRSGLPADLLTIEITETTLMSHPEQALEVVRHIATTGVSISIDDYGTGYSSLAYLNDLAADELKIDRELTSKVVSSARTSAIVGATIALAHRLGLRVVAEGVEDQQTHAALSALDCDQLQGFFYGHPQPAQVMTERLNIHVLPKTPGPQAAAQRTIVQRIESPPVVIAVEV